MRDEWADLVGNEYAGRIYPAYGPALEVPTRHLETLSYSPSLLAAYLNHRSVSGKLAWREAFLSCLDILLA